MGYTLGSFGSVACARPNLSWHLTDQKESCQVSCINRLHCISVFFPAEGNFSLLKQN